jgi:hypothetical protein
MDHLNRDLHTAAREPWFDGFCKRIVTSRKISRRRTLSLMLGGFAGIGTLLRRTSASAQTSIGQSQGGCTRQIVAGNSVAKVSLTNAGITFDRQVSYDQVHKTSSDSITIRKGQTVIAKLAAITSKGAGTAVTVTYGAAVNGVRNIAMKSQDSKVFRGSMDGRAFTTNAEPRSMCEIRFTDGQPVPQISADPSLTAVINRLISESEQALSSCQALQSASPPRRPLQFFFRNKGQNGSPGVGWYEPGETYEAPGCTNCENNCYGYARDHSGLTDWQTWLCPPCIVYAVAAFDIIYFGCLGVCQLPGEGCCPVLCGGPFVCCGSGDHCFQSNLCCPGSMVVCQNVCCGPNVTGCAADGFCGCPSGQTVCGDNCCQAGSTCCGNNQCCPVGSDQCCGDQCCPTGAPCLNNTTCCAPPSNVCGGTCCAPFNDCCNNVCCPDNMTCVQNTCCPIEQACGEVCCPSGQTCQDPSTGTCNPCQSGTGPVICSNEQSGVATHMCCAPNVSCCNGQCCAAASDNLGPIVCCSPVAGDVAPYNIASYGCHHMFSCTE